MGIDNYMSRPLEPEEEPIYYDEFNNPIYEGEQFMDVEGFIVHREEINDTAVKFMELFGGTIKTAEREKR